MWTVTNTTPRYVNGYKHDANVCEQLQTWCIGMWTVIIMMPMYVNSYKHDAKVCEWL